MVYYLKKHKEEDIVQPDNTPPTPQPLIDKSAPAHLPPLDEKTNKRQPSLQSSILQELTFYLLGLAVVAIIGLLFGLFLNFRLVAVSNEGWGQLQNFISIIFGLPIALGVFAVMAFVSRNFTFLAYPIIAFGVAGVTKETPLVDVLSGYTPIDYSNNETASLDNFVAVALSYVLVHVIVWPMYAIGKALYKKQIGYSRVVAINALLLGVSLMFISACLIVSPRLLNDQLRSRAAIHVPISTTVSGSLNNNDTSYQLSAIDGAENAYAGEVSTYQLKKW